MASRRGSVRHTKMMQQLRHSGFAQHKGLANPIAAKALATKSSSGAAPRSYKAAPSLDDTAANRGLIRKGQKGESVRQLRQKLSDLGYDVDPSKDTFDDNLDAAVRKFQTDRGIKVDGLVGPETTGQLRGDGHVCKHDHGGAGHYAHLFAPSEADRNARPGNTFKAGDLANADLARRRTRAGKVTLAPSGMTEKQKFNHYANIVRANGGQLNPNGQPTVLGIRGMNKNGEVHNTGSTRKYDDMFVVLTPDGRVKELSGATHPGQNSSSASPDVAGRSGGSRDGAGDVGMIHPGNYSVVANGYHAGSSSYRVKTIGGSGKLPGVRDTDHDGRFTNLEQHGSAQRGDYLTGVLFHQGGSNAPSSIGCQTLAPNDYRTFVDAVGGGSSNFNFTLVDAYRG